MDHLEGRVAEVAGADVVDRQALEGGEVGRVSRVTLADGRTLVAKTGPTPLSVEGDMLRYLAAESSLPVPAVVHASDDLLLMSYVPGDGAITPAVERDAAAHLAALHGERAHAYGFPFDTPSGPLVQPNPWCDSWIDFFRDHRLGHVVDVAVADGALPGDLAARTRALAADLDAILEEPVAPSLLHGDIWRENLVVRDGRVAAFLDPALSYGHAELELAYVRWTDTLGEPFFDRYRSLRGIDDGFFEERYDAYVLHPLLEHVWFFGDAYLDEVAARLSRLGY